MEHALTQILTDFGARPIPSAKGLRQLMEIDRQAFFQTALPVLRSCPDIAGFPYLLTLLMTENMILGPLADSSVFTFEEAVAIGRYLVKIDPLFDIRMVRGIGGQKSSDANQERLEDEQYVRLLEILAVVSDGARIVPALTQSLHHPSPHVRSKAALLMGRVNKSHRWVEQRLAEPDARVRANAIESLWGVENEGSRQVLWGALADSNNRVVGNALLGLYRLGEAQSIPLILDLLSRPEEKLRLTGIWAMGESGDPRFLPVLTGLLRETAGKPLRAAFGAVGKLKRKLSKFGPEPAFAVHLVLNEPEPGNWGSLWAGVRQTGSGESAARIASKLKPTQFVLYENDRPVMGFALEEETHAEALSFALALPRPTEKDGALHKACEQAVIQGLCHKRKNDAWALLRYSREAASPGVCRPARDHSILGLKAEESAAAIEIRYHTEMAPITAAGSQPGARSACAPDPAAAIRMLLTAAAARPLRGGRHILLVQTTRIQTTPDETAEVETAEVETAADVWHDLAQTARASRTALHVISLVPDPETAAACRLTGGAYMAIPSLEDLPKTITALCATLPQCYKLRYRSQLPEFQRPSTLKLQVYTGSGWGQEVWGGIPEPVHTAEVA